nr:hypothetical protein [uncultured Treponema sp.]
MKIKLMIQSLSPLALLTIIRNYTFIWTDDLGNKYNIKQILSNNSFLLIVDLVCLLWILLSIWFFVEFKAFFYANTQEGDTITIHKEKTDESLNFFITLILPLVIDNVGTWQGMTVFFIILIMICILLAKTNLFYANPILTILGYHIFEFTFDKEEITQCICICDKKSSSILLEKEKIAPVYRQITTNIYFIKER